MVLDWVLQRIGAADGLHLREVPEYIVQDEKIRTLINKHYGHAGISSVEIERLGNKMRVIIWTARPGMIIGKQGAEIERLREEIVSYLRTITK